MQFGITLKPDISIERIVGLTRRAEKAGFEYGWIFDSHVLWLEPYPLLTLIATKTKSMRLGTCVTNPATRDITVTSGDLGESVQAFRALTAGKETEYDGRPTRLTWATGSPPVWIAGYGPKVLDLAGRIADGVILQFADPDLIAWCMTFVKKGAEAAGRDPRKIGIMAAAPVWVSDDLKLARDRVRWFPALVSNHVVDLISRYKPEELPPALTSYVSKRGGYDYKQHCEVD